MPIETHPLLDPVDSGISYGPLFEQYEAAVAAGLDLWTWENGGYPKWFMANVIAWHRGHGRVEVNTQDAIARKMRAEAKKRGRR